MSNESAKIDVNNRKTLLAVTDDASAEIRRVVVDPTTGRLKVSATVSGSGVVTTDQSTPQTIGDTTNRLTKLWATDITVTNAITGSVTGNAGTVTGLTLTTNLTNNGGAGTLTWPAAGATLTIPTGGGTLGTAAFTAATAYEVSGAVSSHASLTTGVHGVGAGTIAKTSDITATKLDDFATPDNNTDLNANTTNHGLLLQAVAPAAGLTNVVAIENGETVYKNKALFDATVPETQAFSDSAAVGTAVVAARRDHKHAMMAAPTTVSGNAGTATKLAATKMINGTAFDGSADIVNNFPEGFLINGKIVPSVAADNLGVAIKGMDGNDPSATNPVYVRINGVVRSITSALSVSAAAGTNWMNLGSAELATKETDLFVYINYNATAASVGVTISRFPGSKCVGDFTISTTAEKGYITSNPVSSAVTDYNSVIGRFAATLSAGAGYTWTVPTFTATNLIQRPIYETRWLDWLPSGAGYTAGGARYKIVENTIYMIIDSTANITGNSSTPFAAANTVDNQMNTDTGTAVIAKSTSTITVANNPQNINGFYEI